MIAFKSPFPRTDCTILLSLMYLFSFSLKMMPNLSALRANSSSLITFKAAIATLHANGFPPKVDQCSPGFIVSIISFEESIAETGNTPPESAWRKINISGLIPK